MGGPALSEGKETVGSECPPFSLGGISTLHGGGSNKGGETGQDTTMGQGSLNAILCLQVCLVLFGVVVGVGLNLGIQKVKTAMFAHL